MIGEVCLQVAEVASPPSWPHLGLCPWWGSFPCHAAGAPQEALPLQPELRALEPCGGQRFSPG